MNIRPYRKTDRAALLAIHERQCVKDGLPYLFNDPEDLQNLATVVAVEDGWIIGAATGRKILEGSTILNHSYGGRGSDGPVKRWMLISELIRHSAQVAYQSGYTELFAATAPHQRGYGNRLCRELSFVHDLRSHYYLDLAERFGQKEAVSGRA